MAELGSLANLAAVIGASFQIASVLIDVGTALGSAGDDIKALGDEIACYHRILKSVQHALRTAMCFHASSDELTAAQDILNQSSKIFTDLENTFIGLHVNQGVTNLARVKWTLKRNRVRLLQKKMRTLSGRLQFMLVIMTFTNSLTPSIPSARYKTTMSTDAGRWIPAKCILQEEADCSYGELYSPSERETFEPVWDSTTACALRAGQLTRFPSMNFEDNSSRHTLAEREQRSKNPRYSDLSDLPSWPLPHHVDQKQGAPSIFARLAVRVSAYPNRSYRSEIEPAVGDDQLDMTVAEAQQPIPGQRNGVYNIFESKEDSCQQIIAAALDSQGVGDDWWQWRLYLVCEDQERCLDYLELPILVLTEMGFEGKRVKLMLRHRNDERIEECSEF